LLWGSKEEGRVLKDLKDEAYFLDERRSGDMDILLGLMFELLSRWVNFVLKEV